MFEKPPTLIPAFLLGVAETFAITFSVLDMGFWTVFGYYYQFIGAFLIAIAAGVYLIRAVGFVKSQNDIGNPEVRKLQHHAMLAREINQMDREKIAHHTNVLNQLNAPFRLAPTDEIETLDGLKISGQTLINYVDGLREEKVEGEGDQRTYSLSRERYADKKDRDGFRQMADELVDHKFAVSAPFGNKPVIITQQGLIDYIKALFNKNQIGNERIKQNG